MSNKKDELDRITEKYYDSVFGYCRSKIKNDDVAYDITQNVFLALCKCYIDQDIQSIERWLYKVACKQVMLYLRSVYHQKKYVVSDELDDTLITASYTPFSDDNYSEEDIESMKSKIMESLNTDELKLYTDVFQKKIDYTSIAKQYGITDTTLRKRISRIHKKLKVVIQKMLYCITWLIR